MVVVRRLSMDALSFRKALVHFQIIAAVKSKSRSVRIHLVRVAFSSVIRNRAEIIMKRGMLRECMV